MAAYIYKWFGVLLAGVILSASARPADRPHPLYISVTEISHNPKDKILEVSCKMFTNDLETALEKMSKTRVDLSVAKDKAASDKLIADYVERHLRLRLDGKAAVLHFVGSEKENDGTWSYFQVNEVSAVKKIDIMNNLLYDSFEQEINIMHVSVGGEKKSTRLNYPDVNTSIEF